MDIRKIYIDMDGVLADFDGGIVELCGIPALDQGEKTEEQDEEMFAAMRKVENFYRKLKPLPNAVDMLNKLWDKYGDKCEILTGIPKPKRGIIGAGEDKKLWIQDKLNFNIKVNIVLRADKKNLCQGKEDILIDDFIDNIKDWEESGGTGILHKSPDLTIKAISNLER